MSKQTFKGSLLLDISVKSYELTCQLNERESNHEEIMAKSPIVTNQPV